jgi:hypothetical protein
MNSNVTKTHPAAIIKHIIANMLPEAAASILLHIPISS